MRTGNLAGPNSEVFQPGSELSAIKQGIKAAHRRISSPVIEEAACHAIMAILAALTPATASRHGRVPPAVSEAAAAVGHSLPRRGTPFDHVTIGSAGTAPESIGPSGPNAREQNAIPAGTGHSGIPVHIPDIHKAAGSKDIPDNTTAPPRVPAPR